MFLLFTRMPYQIRLVGKGEYHEHMMQIALKCSAQACNMTQWDVLNPDIFLKFLRTRLSADAAFWISFLCLLFVLSIKVCSSMPNCREIPLVPPNILGFHSVLYIAEWRLRTSLPVLGGAGTGWLIISVMKGVQGTCPPFSAGIFWGTHRITHGITEFLG